MPDASPDDVARFWFETLSPRQWWASDPKLDAELAARFGGVHAAAMRCELYEWRRSPIGRLAEVIVLDQFSRNLYRGDPRSYAADPIALCLAQEAVRIGDDEGLSVPQRQFLYMPFMHSESALIHRRAVELYGAPGLEGALASEMRHKAIIDRFGRYPHRNRVLGRESTPEEDEFLARTPGGGY